ncbi:MAG TPA: hypothetical protein VF424_03730, partial [Vicinamibacterales bacterium]
GQYVFTVVSSSRIRSVTWNGQDYTNKPFDASAGIDFTDVAVTLTTMSNEVTGSVMARDPIRPGETIVVIFPVEREQWERYGLSPARLKWTALTSTAEYRFRDLPAGDYYVAGIPAEWVETWKSPDALSRILAFAVRVSVGWSGKTTQHVPMVPLKR